MATTPVVKLFKFPGSTDSYAVNATQLEGVAGSSILSRLQTVETDISTLSNFDALRYMGTIAGSSTAPGGLTVAANKGDVYKVTSKGYVMGAKVEVGDMLICNKDSTAAATTSNYTTIAANWDIIQTNVDVDAILAHSHDITLNKSEKTLTHTVTPTTTDITASFSNGSATVNGGHGHTGSISIDNATAGGTVGNTDITPAGTVKLTAPTTAGTNDVTITPTGSISNSATNFVTSVTVSDHPAHNHTGTVAQSGPHAVSGTVTISKGTGTANYTPEGTVGNSSAAVTSVTVGDHTISEHEASIGSTSITPAGSVTVNSSTAGGTVEEHTHSVGVTLGGNSAPVSKLETTYTEASQLLELSYATAAVTASVSETPFAPKFTGAPHSHTASFTGTAASHGHTITIEDHDNLVHSVTATKGNHNHPFTGTGAQLVASHSLTAAAHSHGLTIDNANAMSHTVVAPTSTHNHDFTGDNQYIHAAFTGTKAGHTHSFTGTAHNHSGSVTVNNHSGNFTGSATGTVNVTNGKGVVTGISVAEHKITTVDSASCGGGKQ